MSLQRMQDQHTIGFLNSQKDAEIPKTAKENKYSLKELAEEQKSKTYNPKMTHLHNDKSIMSSRAGNVTDVGGPSKFIKSETSNSVWDNSKIEKAAKETKTTIVNLEDPKILRQNAEKERLDRLIASLQTVDQRKAATLSSTESAGNYQGEHYKVNNNNMSIFDTDDFQRLSEKTAGEKVTEETTQRRTQVDESWKTNGKSTTSSDVINRMFDNLNTKIVGK